MNVLIFDGQEYKPIKNVKEKDLTPDDGIISTSQIEGYPTNGNLKDLKGVFTISNPEELKKLIPLGMRNSAILKRDGYLSPKNADLE